MRGRDIWISCDYCDLEYHADRGNWTYRELVVEARKDGWSCGPNNDWCPEHRKPTRRVPPLDDGLGPKWYND